MAVPADALTLTADGKGEQVLEQKSTHRSQEGLRIKFKRKESSKSKLINFIKFSVADCVKVECLPASKEAGETHFSSIAAKGVEWQLIN